MLLLLQIRFSQGKKLLVSYIACDGVLPVTYLFFLHDAGINGQFLADIGASHSLLQISLSMTRHKHSKTTYVCLVVAKGSKIPIHVYEILAPSFESAKYHWKFLVAYISLPIIGADFLAHFHPQGDVAQQLLVSADSYSSTLIDTYSHLFRSYPEVIQGEFRKIPKNPAKLNIYHNIKTCPPVFTRFRHQAPNCLSSAKWTFAEIKDMILCQNSSSPCSSPLHIVMKKKGFLGLYVDYWHLNVQTEPDH
ncbi:uncharacterized protein [Palaemon carinicauda]|uniref:uncharacterized protein n=1 Tax=Palaemon carinicauda TaxID=392227 RepID=UPI0035B61C2F